MSMAYGFYWGIFYPAHSPPYKPDDEDNPSNIGVCFAPAGQPAGYKGFLYQTARLRSNYILYA